MSDRSATRRTSSDAQRASYARHAYPRLTHEFAHPARIFAMTGLFGVKRASLEGLKILEIGCNRGDTLNWVAATR